MLKASFKSLWARKVALLLSTVAIMLGTAFVGGSLTFTDMLDSTFKGIVGGSVADVNVQAKGSSFSSDGSEQSIDQTVVDKVAKVEGVASAHGTIASNSTYLLGKNGKPMTTGAPGIGTNFVDAPASGGQQGLVMKSGHRPEGSDQVVIDPESLTKAGLSLGDRIKIYTTGKQGVVEKTIVGTALYGAKGSSAGASYAIFDTHTAQQLLLDGKDAYQSIWVVTAPGADPQEVARRINGQLPQGMEALSGKELSEKINEVISSGLRFVTVMLLVFAGISLLVGSFLIVNTFTILVAQRARELALFRAMGASRGQVMRSVVFEALILGLVGSTLGLGLGLALAFGISQVFGTLGLDISGSSMQLTGQAVLATYLVGVLVTIGAAVIPAVRASRVPPVAAMSGDFATGASGLGWRAVVGSTVTAIGGAVLAYGLFGQPEFNRMWAIGLGALALVLGIAAVSPIVGAPVIWLIGRAGEAVFGTTGRLAELNAARNPRRTAITASALMVGLALVTAFGVVAASVNVSTQKAVTKNLRGDFVVTSANQQPFSPSIGDAMAKVDGVEQVHRVRFVPGTIGGEETFLGAMPPTSFDKILKQTMTSGSLSDFAKNTVILRDEYAKEKNLSVGKEMEVTLNGKQVALRVAGIFSMEKGAGLNSVITTVDTIEGVGMRATDSMLTVDLRSGADKASVKNKLNDIISPLPLASVADQKEFADSQSQQINTVLYLIYALLGLAIVIAIFGVVNTLGLSVIERTREIGLLRAVGLNKSQVRRMIVLESLTISLLGAVLGIGLGLVLGIAAQRALAGDGLSDLALPWEQLGISVLVAFVVGVLAGLWPSVRATNLDVLKAIAAD
ncbi:hypothetical protein KEM60_01719 [Austwickia sp. TVS 96-490-7B]|uniref:ABC transporter permease n=1 Tax=Austwickia sp. TVS 96-490-7B TaxID=2830843 RepID=UPI001C59058E|nr:FtsX-like permease family protein [Austwickia sp. TVS 96-490-7B]MBW3085519.1 hypothetical protein [Austwickia sp. TVS 96-490-7B]